MDTATSKGPIHEEITEAAPCTHCGLPVGPYPVLTPTAAFCCSGCNLVYDALQDAGYSDTYYRIKQRIPTYKNATPARVEPASIALSELDTPSFLEEHARLLDDGTYSLELFLDGVHCAACVWLVERLPFELAGVVKARLDLPRARLFLQFHPDEVTLSAIGRWLSQFGYAVHPIRHNRASQRTEAERSLLIKVGICWALAGNVMLFAFALYSGLDISSDTTMLAGTRWASFVLALIAVAYGGSEFMTRAWSSIRLAMRSRQFTRLHIDTPISIGILVGFGHSAWATWTNQGDIWFDSITVLIAALLTARWLQLRSRRMAGDASDRLLSMIPSMARRLLYVRPLPADPAPSTLSHEVVRVSDLHRGDLIEVPVGEVFPVDGIVTSGASSVDRSILTGESHPEAIKTGSSVDAGATNIQAPVIVRVSTTGEQTRVGKLLSWIRDQDTAKAPVVQLADRLSGFFVAGLLLLALLTAALWLSIDPPVAAQHVVALLVISCPCALGMATPLALAIASGRAARRGIFIKTDDAIEQLTHIDAVVLDKTGTLTEGQLAIVHHMGDREALRKAALLETHSNHPIARAIVTSMQKSASCPPVEPEILNLEAIPGKGLRGHVEGSNVVVGRPDWVLESTSQDTPDMASTLKDALEAYAITGFTPVAVAVDGHLASVIALGDSLRDNAPTLVQALYDAGIQVYILSGDHDIVVQRIARDLGISRSHARGHQSPEEKHRFIEHLQKDLGYRVAMVGDGVNDAVALQTAHVGVAVQGGATPSLVAADVFMTREGLTPLTELLAGAQGVMRVIKGNLGISVVYNVLGASAAMLGFVTPLVAALAMPISSLVVVAASIAQRTFRKQETTAPTR